MSKGKITAQLAREDIINFIELNGWEEVFNTPDEYGYEYTAYTKDNNIGIDVSHEEVVLINSLGDFMHIRLGSGRQAYYTLLGALIHFRCIDMGFKEVGE